MPTSAASGSSDPGPLDSQALSSPNPTSEQGHTFHSNEDHEIDPEGEESMGLLNSERQRLRRRHNKLIVAILVISFIVLIIIVALMTGPIYWGPSTPSLTNGTHFFSPTVLLLSFDGLRSDYLDRGLTPAFSQIARRGSRAEYMTPAFPSVTFANHYSLVTGLYPESHGIIGNSFYDPILNASFYYKRPEDSWPSKWWGGEPIWTTSVKQGVPSAIHMWPGSSSLIAGARPTYYDPFDQSWTLKQKTDRLLGWLDMERKERPHLIAGYIPDVDMAGHAYGPDSIQVDKSLESVNGMMTDLLRGLEVRNLTNIVNIIIVSDHGMSRVGEHKKIALDDWIRPEDVQFVHGFPLAGIWPSPGADVETLYQQLQQGTTKKPFKVYRKEEIPARYHYQSSPRIAPLLCVPDVGFYMAWGNATYKPGGMHGYDNEAYDMRASFLSQGPAFRSSEGEKAPWLKNVEVYGLISHILGLQPSVNNGTIDWNTDTAYLRS